MGRLFLFIIVNISVIVGEGEADDIIVGQTVDPPLEPGRPAGQAGVVPQPDGLSRPQLGRSPDTGPADSPHLQSE